MTSKKKLEHVPNINLADIFQREEDDEKDLRSKIRFQIKKQVIDMEELEQYMDDPETQKYIDD